MAYASGLYCCILLKQTALPAVQEKLLMHLSLCFEMTAGNTAQGLSALACKTGEGVVFKGSGCSLGQGVCQWCTGRHLFLPSPTRGLCTPSQPN